MHAQHLLGRVLLKTHEVFDIFLGMHPDFTGSSRFHSFQPQTVQVLVTAKGTVWVQGVVNSPCVKSALMSIAGQWSALLTFITDLSTAYNSCETVTVRLRQPCCCPLTVHQPCGKTTAAHHAAASVVLHKAYTDCLMTVTLYQTDTIYYHETCTGRYHIYVPCSSEFCVPA